MPGAPARQKCPHAIRRFESGPRLNEMPMRVQPGESVRPRLLMTPGSDVAARPIRAGAPSNMMSRSIEPTRPRAAAAAPDGARRPMVRGLPIFVAAGRHRDPDELHFVELGAHD